MVSIGLSPKATVFHNLNVARSNVKSRNDIRLMMTRQYVLLFRTKVHDISRNIIGE